MCSALCVCVCVVFNIIYGLPLRAWIIGLTESYFTRKMTLHRSVRWNIRQGKPGEIYRPIKQSLAQVCKFKLLFFNVQTPPMFVFSPFYKNHLAFVGLCPPLASLKYLAFGFLLNFMGTEYIFWNIH